MTLFFSSLQKYLLVFFCLATLCLNSSVLGQAIWLETGLAYAEQFNCEGQTDSCFPAYLKVGMRGLFPVAERTSLYLAPYWLGGFGLDAGAWIRFPTTLDDLEGLNSYAGAGLSLTQGRFGLALSAAISYELSRNLDLTLSYTHRPLFIPRFAQTFDLSLGLAIGFE